ncbi:bifunctional nuclease family protein [Frankia sp. AgKG'84/4]|uniref:bifunctional nuclease family protein n=1 Tax=Frankia sp. AgKG'84/4 TaxID=573490 RepID=UPI00200FDD7D|nr:bifunctional nuclease family protein [Frankia sp. AgKG'84/4]MCL9797105.1 bifunctional nuclease family protein [Frankia sp. AgKG'84/4]
MHRLDIVGVRVELPSKQPIVLLKEVGGERYLPIWIGAVEATAIAFAQEGITTARPMTHDLMRDVLRALQTDLTRVTITDLQDGVFFATLVFGNGTEVSARPSDAIALAMRMGAPVYGVEAVLAEAGITVPEEQEQEQESELEKFREFLDTISPEDFNTPGS